MNEAARSDVPGEMNEDTGPRVPRRWIAAAVAVLAAALAGVALRRPTGVPVQTAPALRRDLLVPILSDGTLEPPPGGELRAPEAATVAGILVREGEPVRKGTPLVRLQSPELSQTAFAARENALQRAEEHATAVADWEQARREAAHLKEIFEADERLVKEGAIPRATAETDELAYRQAEDRARAAHARLDPLGGNHEGDRAAPSRLELAEASARELERRLAALTVRAPTDGIAYGLPRKVGETVSAGAAVANVADPEHLRVRARVDQPDLPRIEVGQRLIVTFDGLPDRHWEGKVLAVSAGVREAGGREVGEVLGEISDSHLSLPPNASVNVQIVVGEKRGVLAIPRAALFRDGERRFVYRLEDGRARRCEVKVGLVGANEVEIVSGLAEKQNVILPGSTPLSEGLRVTAAGS
ncbi:MAG: efflux RND transporter periplasmic adaptor subunit [Thermoanaerobaculia bacterium]